MRSPVRSPSRHTVGLDPNDGLVVKVPSGAAPGSSIDVTTPDGNTLSVEVPAGAMPGDVIKVSTARKVRVTIPRGVRAGDQMKARAPDGSTFVFTVPEGVGEPVWWNPLRTSVIDIAVPRVREGSTDEADAASASTIRVRVPQTWNGEALLAVAHRGREMLVQVPAGAAPGDEMLLDLPGRRKLKLKLRVPQDHRPGGNDEAAVRTPSGKLVLVKFPPGVRGGDTTTIEIVDDAEPSGAMSDVRLGGTVEYGAGHEPRSERSSGGAQMIARAVLRARFGVGGSSFYTPLEGGPQAEFHMLSRDDSPHERLEVIGALS